MKPALGLIAAAEWFLKPETRNPKREVNSRKWYAVLIAAVLSLALASCRSDMQDQPRLKPLRRSDFYADLRSSRPVIAGTVARGQLREDTYLYSGYIGKDLGNEMPFAVTPQVMERGRERYNIFCAPCHSRVGDGNGMIVQRGYRRPPSYHIDRLRTAPLGHFYDVMTNGFGAMSDYAAQVPPHDRWAIAAYIRALQLSQNAPASLVPAGTRMPSATPPASGTPGNGGTQGQAAASPGNAPSQVSAEKNGANLGHQNPPNLGNQVPPNLGNQVQTNPGRQGAVRQSTDQKTASDQRPTTNGQSQQERK